MDIEELERNDLRKKQRIVGLLFSAAFALALLFAYWMGALRLGSAEDIYVLYNFAGGLDVGSPIRLGGIKAGHVSGIDFAKNSQVKLKLSINREAFKQVTDDSKFFINLAGLIGERYVEIVPGEGSPAKSGQTLQGVNPPRIDQLLSQGYGIFGDVRDWFNGNKGDIKEIFQSLNDLASNLNKLIGSATPKQKKQINQLLTNFAAMSDDLRATLSTFRKGVEYASANGGTETWDSLRGLTQKANKIELDDIRRLMLQDGVKVNFSSKKIPYK